MNIHDYRCCLPYKQSPLTALALNGTVDENTIKFLVDMSYDLTK